MRNVSLMSIFFKSLYSPKEIAKYRFLTIGKSIQLVFILALFLSLGGFYDMIFKDFMNGYGVTGSDAGSKTLMTIIVAVIAYIFNAGLLFLVITILASIGEPIAKRLERKLPYRQSWRLTACSATLPVVIFSLLHLFKFEETYFFLLALIIVVGVMLAAIRAIPKPKKRN
ncbi:hypothetical protein J6TS1_22210 [Siminovitchia terrae]|uniref:DUF1189 domain-containing protein n=1 Tax=Siminovitchia terrae TaxID=1914933 RepID=A0A429XDE3_SIMTE|nr:DUF1189 family protein [Siminovitchia terrae]RST61450.1 DUF1189 domain-containing protein [Siminovitchia terrae]GIN89624.1 hypothetical protein J22TS1_06750 [Siminovitchia terrae]GIN96351.1 hypothetical protein J6TS1_22210 [Siminovitchia terrae]